MSDLDPLVPQVPAHPDWVAPDQVRRLVETFYRAVRADSLLGPIFQAHVADWEEHHQRLGRFWMSVMTGARSYKGTPLQAHLALPGLTEAHFARWLALFEIAAGQCFDPDAAALFQARARRIAQSIHLGYALRQTGGNCGPTAAPARTPGPAPAV